MALNIKDAEVEGLARRLAELTGEPLTVAVRNALQERLARAERGRVQPLREELAAIRRRCARLPVLDGRSPDEILGYDEHGLPRP